MDSELLMCGYRQLVSRETRHQKGQNSSLLDHIYFRGSPQLVSRQFNKNLLGDDHNLVGLSIYTASRVQQQVYSFRRNISKVSETEFETIFNCSLPWEFMSEPDVNLSLDSLVEKIKWTLNHVCPEVRYQHKVGYQPWMTSNLKGMCRYKRYLHNQARISKSTVVWNIYKKYRNIINT